jgi:hypothetical protein
LERSGILADNGRVQDGVDSSVQGLTRRADSVASDPGRDDEGHPVATGLLALIGVGLVVGLMVSGAALAATSLLGLRGDGGTTTTSSDQSLYLPRPSPTDPASGPLVTLRPGPKNDEKDKKPEATEETEPEFTISLSAAQTEVGPMQNIDLTGVYPGGEGAIVQVQRYVSGRWEDFASVDAVVTNETFATYVQTGQTGVNRFRVKDTSSAEVSNEVRVRVR